MISPPPKPPTLAIKASNDSDVCQGCETFQHPPVLELRYAWTSDRPRGVPLKGSGVLARLFVRISRGVPEFCRVLVGFCKGLFLAFFTAYWILTIPQNPILNIKAPTLRSGTMSCMHGGKQACFVVLGFQQVQHISCH